MADGDIVHSKLARRYHKSYKKVCSPNDFNAESAAHTVAVPLKSSLEKIGDAPVDFIRSCMDNYLSQLPQEPLWRSTIDYGQLSRQIDKEAQKCACDHKAMEMAKRAVRHEADNFRQGGTFDTEAAVQNYIMRVYDQQFAHRVPQTDKHLNGLTQATVDQRLSEMRPHVAKEARTYAKEAVERRSMKRLRRRRYKEQRKGLHDPAY